ncbi:TPA: hypothetical protein U2H88_003821 [Acinetobacter nosocomialis]|nr:hypothetical protein [Acinetobacter nosocomialis]
MTDLNKEREAFERLPLAELAIKSEYVYYNEETNSYWPNEDFCPSDAPETMNFAWEAWQEKAKAQAVPEHIITLQRNGEVFKFDLLDLLRRSLKSSKVLKTRENWSHVSKMIGIGSTTSTLLCKAMKVDPDGFSFVESESGAEG